MDYLLTNKDSWNKKVDLHIASEFYQQQKFLEGQSSLNSIETELIGLVKGKSILHLQCHFGQDSLSLQRMGAQVTGVDFSEQAILRAREVNEKLGLSAQFVCCDLYELSRFLDQEFDLVFTSYGTIGWLPDIHEWARLVSKFTRQGGRFILVEFHPLVWMFDDDLKYIKYSYFNREPIVEVENGSYADTTADIESTSITWNHSMSSVIDALLQEGFSLQTLKEYDYSPYYCFANMIEFESGKYRIKHLEDKIPLVYALSALKR
ncbi:class I SAM-dependent methyltransferase [Portibacter marinus]|uniref:class I SAM-dependent methyltransferase n=1 Tax=Portibacter marinus TaxID=2898660 RepID=UPI001F1ED624|nr:class I SAM-dependent methyltransferase [Portibacter marinus]